jgi:hypothetical protein
MQPVLEVYHKDLTRCLVNHCLTSTTTTGGSGVERVIGRICSNDIWPSGKSGNSHKEVLLLATLESIITSLGVGVKESCGRISGCIGSDNSRVCERAMMMWKVPTFVEIFNNEAVKDERIADEVVRATGGELRKGWNPTVNKMRYLVLERIKEGLGEEGFKDTAERVYGRSTARTSMGNTQDTHTKEEYVVGEDRSDDSDVESVASDDCQLTRIRKVAVKRNWSGGQGEVEEERTVKEQMKEWRNEGNTIPPSTITGVAPWGKGGRGQPPTTITGVAPWAMGGRGQPPTTITGVAPWGRGQPPVTVTGVAPWAMAGRGGMGRGGRIDIRRSREEDKIGEEKDMDIEDEKEISIEDEKDTPSEEDMSNSSNPGYLRLLNFMETVKPPKTAKYTPWAMTQLMETPTLLPNLKFHDLVFGQVLGEGAFR